MAIRVGLKIEGLQKVNQNLSEKLSEIDRITLGTIWTGGLMVQREAQKRVPVERGNLRASAYTRRGPSGKKLVEVGFEAAYALFVHENLEQKLKGQPRPSGLGVYWGPKGEPKFLEKALRETADDIVKMAVRRTKSGL